jgi:hypothetical protein
MLRLWLALLCVTACASAPIVGIERVRAVSAGQTVLASAEARWERYLVAQEPRFAAVLALDETRSKVPGIEGYTHNPANQLTYTPSWRPDDKQFVIAYVLRRTVTVPVELPDAGCPKYNRRHATPCPPPIPHFDTYAFIAEASLTLVYDRAGTLVSERSTGPVSIPFTLIRD